MMRIGGLVGMTAAAALLAGCGGGDRKVSDGDTASISFEGLENDMDAAGATQGRGPRVAVAVPGFSTSLSVPAVPIGADTDIGGIRLRPGARLTAMNVTGKAGDGTGGEGKGTIELRFADPAAPAAVLGYYRGAARGAGWTEVPPPGGVQFAATRQSGPDTQRIVIAVAAAGAGSTGRLALSGT